MKKKFLSIKKNPENEDGAIAVIIVLLVTVFISFIAFVVDIGYFYQARRQLQTAADASALAAVSDKIKNRDDVQVLETARSYAAMNDFGSGPSLWLDESGTAITDDSVTVVVRKRLNTLFAFIFALSGGGVSSEKVISAQAKAKRVYLAGMRNIVPWGLMTINARKIEISVAGNSSDLSYNSSTDSWDGNIASPAAASANGQLATLKIYNQFDYAHEYPGIAAVTKHTATDPISNVYLEKNTLSPGEGTNLYIASTLAPSRVSIGAKNYNEIINLGGGLYRVTVTAPSINGPINTFPISVRIGSTDYFNMAVLISRQKTYSLNSLELGQIHFTSSGGSTSVKVTMKEFEFGELYNLKLAADSEAGNFNSLALGSPSEYGNHIENGFPGTIEIGNIIETLPGNRLNAAEAAIDKRLDGCGVSFGEWEDSKDPECKRLIPVAIIEQIEKIAGTSKVKVASFGIFFIESFDGNITGRFVEYTRSGRYTIEPPIGSPQVYSARLEKVDY